MLESPATDPGRAAEEMPEALIAELREDAEIATRCAGWVSDDSEPKPRVDEHLSWRAARTIAQLQADLIAARKERDEARADMKEADDANVALNEKLLALAPHGSCACSYDTPGEVCMHHSPMLLAAQEEAAQLRARLHEAEKGVEAMREGAAMVCDVLAEGAARSMKGRAPKDTERWETVKFCAESAASTIRSLALTPAPEANQEAGDGR